MALEKPDEELLFLAASESSRDLYAAAAAAAAALDVGETSCNAASLKLPARPRFTGEFPEEEGDLRRDPILKMETL